MGEKHREGEKRRENVVYTMIIDKKNGNGDKILCFMVIFRIFAPDMEKITIGFDAKRIVRNGTGLGSYGRTLVNDLAQLSHTADGWPLSLQLRLYAPDPGRDDLRSQVKERENLCFCYPSTINSNPSSPGTHHQSPFTSIQKSYWRSRGIVNNLIRDKVEVFHGLSGELPIGISHWGMRSVVTIHDLIFMRHPEFYNWIDTKIYTWKFRQTISEADHIIAISKCTKRDIMELGGVDESRISVVYQSYAPRFKGNHGGAVITGTVPTIPQRYILNVGSIERRKNILLAVKALPLLPDDVHLVVVGRHTPYADEVKAYAEREGIGHRVTMLHGISDEELPAIYAGAETFVYPSVYEGFGIPILEAISSGLPVVACTGSCLEEAGGPDMLYVAPDDVQAMANAISQTLRGAEGREQRIRRSQEYIRRFEGADVASKVADIYLRLWWGR